MNAPTRVSRFLFTALAVLLVSAPAFAQLKIGYIRPTYIFSQYEPYIEAQRKIEEYQTTEIGKLEQQKQELDQNIEQYQQQSLMMSEEQQQLRQQELARQNEALQIAYDELTRVGGLMDQKQEELIAPIIEDINDVLMRIGETDEYDYIFDADAGGLIWADEQYDLSEAVLEELTQGIAAQ